MLTYSFEDLRDEAMYAYLYRRVKEDILGGKLRAHEKLPSKRSFAKNLGVSITTVENAYAQLATEGYLYARPKRGFFVSPLDERLPPDAPKRDAAPPPPPPDYYADLASDGVATEPFPFSVWLRLMRGVMATEREETLLTERPAGGLLQLRAAIASQLWAFRGMQVSPEQVVVGAGAEYLYGVLIQLLGRAQVFGLEDPGLVRLRRIYERNDVDCRHIPMDESGVRLDALRASGAQVLHITPSHHFPTGAVMPARRRYALLAWAAEREGRCIIEDDYDCEFRLAGQPIPTLQSIDTMEKVIYINTFSQSLAPAFRMGYLVLPPHLARRFYETLGFASGTVSCLEQLTLARFLSEGHFERHLNRMRTYYRALRDRFLEALRASPLGPRSRVSREDAGLHFLLAVDTPWSDEALVERGRCLGLRLSFLSEYCHDPALRREHVLLVQFAGVAPERVDEVVRRLCCVFSDHASGGLGDFLKKSP